MEADFNDALDAVLVHLQNKTNEYYATHYNNLIPPTIVVDGGRKFLRIVKQEPNHRGIWGFVAVADGCTKTLGAWKRGDVFKAATWSTPAKHARTNIFDPDWWNHCDVYGPQYLK